MADKYHCIKKTVRLTPEESRQLATKAEEAGMNEAEYGLSIIDIHDIFLLNPHISGFLSPGAGYSCLYRPFIFYLNQRL